MTIKPPSPPARIRAGWLPGLALALALALLTALAGCYGAPAPTGHTPKTAAVSALEEADAALKAGDTDGALARARVAHEADPQYDDAAFLLASLLGRKGDFEAALALCADLTARSPNFVQAHLLQGILWDRSGNPDAARHSYDATLRALAELPEAERARPEAGLQEALAIFLRDGKLEGIKAANRLLAVYPDYGPARYVKSCMMEKERGFLLRWFSDQGAAPSPAAAPDR